MDATLEALLAGKNPKLVSADGTRLTLEGVMAYTKLSAIRVRNSVREGTLVTEWEQVKGDVKRRIVTPEAIANWRKGVGAHTKREDGRNKFTVWMTPDEFAQYQKLAKANKFEVPIRRANAKKAAKA